MPAKFQTSLFYKTVPAILLLLVISTSMALYGCGKVDATKAADCCDIMESIYRAVEKTGLENTPMDHRIPSFEEFKSSGKMPEKNKCPCGGKYKITDLDGRIHISCSYHGALDKLSGKIEGAAEFRKKHCRANIEVISAAILKRIENTAPPSIDSLFKEGFLYTKPYCLDGGVYSFSKNSIGLYTVSCSFHGRAQ